MNARNRSAGIDVAVVCVTALVYLYLSTHFRVSVLRQDWWWSLRRSDFTSYALDSFSGWSSAGLGGAVPYPTGYLATLLITGAAFVLSPSVAQEAYLFAIAAACGVGGLRFAGARCDPLARLAIVLFAVFNPWVYTETVAGHFYMILAYAATMFLFGEVVDGTKPSRTLACSFLAIVQQLQFALVPILIFVVRLVRRRERLPLTVAAILLLPAAIGIVLNYGTLVATPYVLAWEDGASVRPENAVRLLGYFARYGAGVESVMGTAMDAAALIALTGLAIARARTRTRREAAFGFAALVVLATTYATGTRGPLAAVFSWIVLNVPQSGVFRELYDLLGYTAMAYALLAGIAMRRFLAARIVFAAAGCVLLTAWFLDRPSAYTVAAAAIPPVRIASPPRTRYALFPAFQPLSFHGSGSGLDPDAFELPGNRAALDEFLPAYPVDTALATFANTCDTAALAHLSVSAIRLRPWLRESDASYGPRDGTQCDAAKLDGREFVPELGLSSLPTFGSLDSNVGAGNVFFADAGPSDTSNVSVVRPDRSSDDPAVAWIDARLRFREDPALGQAFGGAMTTSSAVLLAIRPGTPILALVRGHLVDQASNLVATSSHGYRWIPLSSRAKALRCFGTCVVALQGFPPPKVALDPPVHHVAELRFDELARFAVRAQLPMGPASFLRYNVAYSPFWIALRHGTLLRHVRVDAVTNGWYVPARETNSTVFMVNVGAAVQSFFIVLGTVLGLGLIAGGVVPFSRNDDDRAALRAPIDDGIDGGLRRSR